MNKVANILLVYPANNHSAFKIAAETFKSLALKVSNVVINIVKDDEFDEDDIKKYSKLILIGSDAVNDITASLYLTKKLDCGNIKYSTDDYTIKTITLYDCNILLFAGGRPRSTLYSVYRYFELYCGCRWFWDGDRINKCDLPFANINITESPRFQYRGIRYFAHRGLHRFQAEHWSLQDWENEIDWIVKKRLNMFMLRIGIDDIFQKAFPDIVSYPKRDEQLPEAEDGYNDRNLFWSLEYRGELRKKILKYAFERDLMHPEDCGTMTHWYSRTPWDFINKVNPPLLLGEPEDGYNEKTGMVWDIRDNDNLENYFKLTEAHIKEYGKPEIFHTLGLAERNFSKDREENMRLKRYVYHRISLYLKEKYPNAPLLLTSWDLWQQYSPEEVRKLIPELDPEQIIIFDYTSDTVLENNFRNWDIVGKFPWIFGMFGGYEHTYEIRGKYDLANERLKIAKNDSMCKGFVFWPELSHGDTFCGEYVSYNAWENETPTVEKIMKMYCNNRYLLKDSEKMFEIWKLLMPIIQMNHWSTTDGGCDIFYHIDNMAKYPNQLSVEDNDRLNSAKKNQNNAITVLSNLIPVICELENDYMLERDVFDIVRTVLDRYINMGIIQSEKVFAEKKGLNELSQIMNQTLDLLNNLSGILYLHDDYSLCSSLNKLKSVTDTNPNFEISLKHNAECEYSRAHVYENVEYLYIPEINSMFGEVKRAYIENDNVNFKNVEEIFKKIKENYYSTSLADMKNRSEKKEFKILIQNCINTISNMEFN